MRGEVGLTQYEDNNRRRDDRYLDVKRSDVGGNKQPEKDLERAI